MPFSIYTVKLLGLAQTLHRWLSALAGLDRENRERVAGYAEAIAATLARAAHALMRLEAGAGVTRGELAAARAEAHRELGRITGYIETIVSVLDQHLDGRKIAGVKRRLDQIGVERIAFGLAADPPGVQQTGTSGSGGAFRADRLLAAEGYFRALADGLRA